MPRPKRHAGRLRAREVGCSLSVVGFPRRGVGGGPNIEEWRRCGCSLAVVASPDAGSGEGSFSGAAPRSAPGYDYDESGHRPEIYARSNAAATGADVTRCSAAPATRISAASLARCIDDTRGVVPDTTPLPIFGRGVGCGQQSLHRALRISAVDALSSGRPATAQQQGETAQGQQDQRRRLGDVLRNHQVVHVDTRVNSGAVINV